MSTYNYLGVRSGFPVPVRTQNVEFWDGKSILKISDDGSLWAPKASADKMLMVGPNSPYPLGLTLAQAAALTWRAQNLSATISYTALTVTAGPAQGNYVNSQGDLVWGDASAAVATQDGKDQVGALIGQRYENLPGAFYPASEFDLAFPRPSTATSGQWIFDFAPITLPSDVDNDGDGPDTTSARADLVGYNVHLGVYPVAFFHGLYWFACSAELYIFGTGTATAVNIDEGSGEDQGGSITKSQYWGTDSGGAFWDADNSTGASTQDTAIFSLGIGDATITALSMSYAFSTEITTGTAPGVVISGGSVPTCRFKVENFWGWGGKWNPTTGAPK